ncbi:MAG: hypothetical protein JWP09_168 [Candidatus Taylorbacteria bacterium]|nr:hypothetical protein [Candidatus Taylorbacteria bacterium]
MRTLRTKEGEQKYIDVMKSGLNNNSCFFCDLDKQTIIAEFDNFRIIENNFPYDEVAEIHHMIYPKRHMIGTEMTHQERDELEELKTIYCKERNYQYILEGITKISIPAHVHFHLLTLKDK